MRASIHIRMEPYYRRHAFELGLKRVGFQLETLRCPDGPEDWLVIWNRKAGPDEIVANGWEKQGGTVIVVENAYLQKVDKTYYAISVHGHNGSGWFPVGSEDRFDKLGFKLKPWSIRLVDGYRLICAQRGIGSSLMRSPPGWAEKLAAKYQIKGIPYKIRPHPGNFKPKTRIADDLRKASACDIWNSAAGVLALIEGIEVKHHAPHWICENGSSELARLMALHNMSHGQWHFDEIATGEPFARIIANKGKAKW